MGVKLAETGLVTKLGAGTGDRRHKCNICRGHPANRRHKCNICRGNPADVLHYWVGVRVPTSEAVPSAEFNPHLKELPEVLDLNDQVQSGIAELSSSTIQGFIELASSRLFTPAVAPNIGKAQIVGTFHTVNKTEYTVSTT
jgi:hypothetical protein